MSLDLFCNFNSRKTETTSLTPFVKKTMKWGVVLFDAELFDARQKESNVILNELFDDAMFCDIFKCWQLYNWIFLPVTIWRGKFASSTRWKDGLNQIPVDN